MTPSEIEALDAEQILTDERVAAAEQLIVELRAGLQEIHAMRGEDPLIARICNPLIEKSR